MAIQFLPIIKMVAPYLAQIATAAIPAFTSKPVENSRIDPVVAKQIEELQEAVTKNAQSIHVLAENLQQTVQGIEIAAKDAKQQIAVYKAMLFVALGLSGLSTLLTIFLLVR